jgi:GDP-L-fucose synthase
MIKKSSKIFVTGHKGLVGSAILRKLIELGYKNIITKTRKQLDLTDQKKVNKFFKQEKFDGVINAAAKVGGIYANNTYRAEFIYENLAIQTNIIHNCYLNNVKNLVVLGSSCIYPRNAKQPIKEEYLLSGKLEKTNEPYAVAKIAGLKMCESYNHQYGLNYKCLMPCNTYGPNDNYNLETSHFFPALIKKIHQTKIKKNSRINVWGTGIPKRELIYVDDIADACIFFLKKKTNHTVINIGSGKEKRIIDYVNFLIKKIKPKAKIYHDLNQNDGTPRKILDSSLAKKYGWRSKISLEKGFALTYADFLKTSSKK